jgi:hypothetical protein
LLLLLLVLLWLLVLVLLLVLLLLMGLFVGRAGGVSGHGGVVFRIGRRGVELEEEGVVGFPRRITVTHICVGGLVGLWSPTRGIWLPPARRRRLLRLLLLLLLLSTPRRNSGLRVVG